VRLRHLPSRLIVIAEESRSQHENKAKAQRRLRQALYLKLREPVPLEMVRDEAEVARAKTASGRLDVGVKDPRFWPAAGVVLDVLEALSARVSDAADSLGISTANLIGFLESEPKLWAEANQMRARFGHNKLSA